MLPNKNCEKLTNLIGFKYFIFKFNVLLDEPDLIVLLQGSLSCSRKTRDKNLIFAKYSD